MSLSQFDSPPPALPRRAMTTSGHWIDSTETSHHRSLLAPARAPDLSHAAALLAAATRMHDSSDPQALLHVIADEALRLLTADGVVVLAHGRQGPTPVLHLPASGSEADASAATMLCLRLGVDHLLEPGQVVDLDCYRPHPPSTVDGHDQPGPARWRSLLVADLSSARSNRPTRLLWYATTANAFGAAGDLAVLFARHAGLALQTVSERHHLEKAVNSRTVTGQATGILMHRYQITAARAFEILRRCSQERNIKMRDISDTLIHTGELPT